MNDETLFSVCEVLVLKALEQVGKRIVRVGRSRHQEFGDTPKYLTHTYWATDDETVSKALNEAWSVVPAITGGDRLDDDLISSLDLYVHDLVITGIPHSPQNLHYRLRQFSSGS